MNTFNIGNYSESYINFLNNPNTIWITIILFILVLGFGFIIGFFNGIFGSLTLTISNVVGIIIGLILIKIIEPRINSYVLSQFDIKNYDLWFPPNYIINAYIILATITLFNLIAFLLLIILRAIIKKGLEKGKPLRMMRKSVGGVIGLVSMLPTAIFVANAGGFVNSTNNGYNTFNSKMVSLLSFNKARGTTDFTIPAIKGFNAYVELKNKNIDINEMFKKFTNKLSEKNNFVLTLDQENYSFDSDFTTLNPLNTTNPKLGYFFNKEADLNKKGYKSAKYADLDDINSISNIFFTNDLMLETFKYALSVFSIKFEGNLSEQFSEIEKQVEAGTKLYPEAFNDIVVETGENGIYVTENFKNDVVESILNSIYKLINRGYEEIELPKINENGQREQFSSTKQRVKYYLSKIISDLIKVQLKV
ncbi:Colicin V production protein [Mycoplasmopsis maculosa]|uniref:Colicin V production protein n=1 Tax=Mycoplasmopsis maculosa TaxID=114885 RepID=A0A449B4Y6_9BACT|nr:CvpA family protein [Mycoplasmopsis maculosa]VEU75667.1 Colicin V production protein [Mycoplasmopsis maculosa]